MSSSSNVIGKSIGNLKLVSRIGVGGMGTVYRAEHKALGTAYAVKLLHTQFSMDETTAERFRREAVTCSQLRHPNVVFVTDFGFDEDLGIYIIMEYLEGSSLRAVLDDKEKLNIGRMVHIGEQLCDGLDAAHRLGIVHRDLKPDNIMLVHSGYDNDCTKILDFGIAQIKTPAGAEDLEKLTRAGLVLGTPSYISPEQINRKAAIVGPGADIYALGIMFYQMVTGKIPFSGNSEFEILSQHVFKIPNPISTIRPELEGTLLDKLISKMLEKNPKDRPQSMHLVKRCLADALRELRERGHQDAFYAQEEFEQASNTDIDSDMFRVHSPTPMGITNVFQQLTTKNSDSNVANLINALRGLMSVHDDLFFLAVFGVIQREWLDASLQSEEFAQLNKQIYVMLKLLLGSSKDESSLSETQSKVFRTLKNMFDLASDDKERQQALVLVLQPLTTHRLFQSDVLPLWAQVSASGTWSIFKAMMTTEIRLPFGVALKPEVNSEAEDVWPAAESKDEEKAVAPEPEGNELEGNTSGVEGNKGIGYKMRQDISLKSIRNVLNHEISIFGKSKKDSD